MRKNNDHGKDEKPKSKRVATKKASVKSTPKTRANKKKQQDGGDNEDAEDFAVEADVVGDGKKIVA